MVDVARQIEVFKTNVFSTQDASRISEKIHEHFPGSSVHFDLSDCDRVLRIESMDDLNNQEIISLLDSFGHWCEVMN